MKNKRNTLKIIWFFFTNYKLEFLFLILLAAIIGITESLNVAILYPIISEGLDTSVVENPFLSFVNIFAQAIPIGSILVRYCILFIVLAFIVFICKLIFFFFSVRLTAKIVIESKKDVFNKCIHSDYQFFIDNKQGEILYKTSTAPNYISSLLHIISDCSIEIILSASIFILLLSLSWKGTLLIVIGGIGYYYLSNYLSVKIHYKSGRKKLESSQTEAVIITEYTSGVKQIKVFETFPYWKELFDKAISTYWKYYKKGFFWQKFPEILIILLLYFSIGSVVIFIKLQYPDTFINTIPLIGTFAFAVFMILPKISKFGSYRMQFMDILPNVESVFEMLKDKKYNKIENGDKKFIGLNSGIEFKNVDFAYKDRKALLDNFSVKIKKDKMTALVGPSGSGKSTVANLLLRLYDIEKGGVFIDDVNIKEFDIFTFLDKAGFVSQDTFIYNASVKDNIAFGNEYTDQEVTEAAKLANADEFIQQLPERYDTIVGDRGMRLSGGEKQRIAIARAMIRKPEILILDEATSSLDNISENVVQKAINKVSKSCTTFIIAHRLSTIQNADTIHVIDKGKIVESGTHKQLLKKKGKYWELYNIQKGNS